ncbi:MAG: 50S ribosomal protein L10 [Planctomycetes bacterium]|nr:50S ribosomal protein L10 [Planctomycetota bacterium]
MPSAINQMMLTEVKALVDKSSSLILIDASRLKSDESLKLRRDLRGIGAQLKVSKVAILQRAVPAAISKICVGTRSSLGVVMATDMVAAAKIVADLAKDDKIAVRGGMMDGEALDAKQLKRISELPSKHQLQGMLVNVLAAPIVGFARVIAEIAKKQSPPAEPAAPAA